jgi:hypothetical protein
MPGLAANQQYNEQPDSSGQKGIWLSDTVKPEFPSSIKNLNRPSNKPYLLFIKDNQEVDDETRNKTAEQMRDSLNQKKETGLTLSEYLIFQRDYTQRNKQHPEDKYITWLLDSELASSLVLGASWLSDGRQVGVVSYVSGPHSDRGCRSSAVLPIF